MYWKTTDVVLYLPPPFNLKLEKKKGGPFHQTATQLRSQVVKTFTFLYLCLKNALPCLHLIVFS
jgi:hypothetical protein